MHTFRSLALGAALLAGAAGIAAAQQAPATPRAPRAESAERAPRADGAHRGRAEGRARAMRAPRAQPARALLRGIELTDAQRTQLRAIGERHRVQREATVRSLRERRAAGAAARPDSAQRAQRMARAQEIRARQEAEVRAILTPEQRRTFDANRAQLAERLTRARAERGGRQMRGERAEGRTRARPRR